MNQLAISIIVAVVTAALTFSLTYGLNRLSDYRQGMKDIDESFYKPLISLFWNAHHANAYFFAELPMDVQDEIMKFLLANKKRVPPWIEQEIGNLDQCYSGYRDGSIDQIDDADKQFVEDAFQKAFSYVEEQYQSNERRLYHSWMERRSYRKYEKEKGNECNGAGSLK